MAKRFPKSLFVKVQTDSGTDWFQSDDDPACLVEMGQKIKIAKYQLVEISDGEGVAKFSKPRK